MNKTLIPDIETWRGYLNTKGDSRRHDTGARINAEPPSPPNSFPYIVVEQLHWNQGSCTHEFLFVYTDDLNPRKTP